MSETLREGLRGSLSVTAVDDFYAGSIGNWLGPQDSKKNIDFFSNSEWPVESLIILVLILVIFLHWIGYRRLKQSEKRYRTLFENMTQGVFYQRSDGVVIACNPACLELVGLTHGQFIGKTLSESGVSAIHEDGSPFSSEQYPSSQVLKSGKPVHEVIAGVYNRKRKQYVWLSINATPQFKPGGRSRQVFVTLHDITDIKIAHKALDKEHQHLQDILEGTRAGTWEWNVQTGETILNNRWAEIVGYTLEEISPTTIDTWNHFLHPDDLDESKAQIQRHLSGETDYYEFELRMRHKSGDWVWVLTRGKVVSYSTDGLPLWMAGIHSDITSLKQEEEMRILHLEKQRDELIREVNHRIKNHLQGLIGLLAHRKKHGEIYINVINEVIAQIKSIATVYGLQTELAGGDINLCRMLDAIVSSISRVSLYFSYEHGLASYKIDQDKAVALSLVINELIMNSVKHAQDLKNDAKIIIKCRRMDEHVSLIIKNPGHLPGDFNFESNQGIGIGLELAKVMLPSQGAKLSISGLEGEVLVELALSQPLIIINPIIQ